MSTFRHIYSALALALILTLIGNAVLVEAQSAPSLDKHSRKVQNALSKYPQGSYLHLVLTSAPDAYGSIGPMTESGFAFTAADTNSVTTYRYAEVDRVKADKQRIGHGAEPIHIRHFLPIVITAAAATAGALTYQAMR